MHANYEPVEFDFFYADLLKSCFNTSAADLKHQINQREEAIATAKDGFVGGYARHFDTIASQSMDLLKGLIAALEGAEKAMEEYIQAAHAEESTRQAIRDWEQRRMEAQAEQSRGTHYAGAHADGRRSAPDPGPRPEPHPQFHFSAEVPQRAISESSYSTSGTGSTIENLQANGAIDKLGTLPDYLKAPIGAGVTSAVPINLLTCANILFSLNKELSQNSIGRLGDIYKMFINSPEGKTHWGTFEANHLIRACHLWISDSVTDSSWLSGVADAMLRAGTGNGLKEISEDASLIENLSSKEVLTVSNIEISSHVSTNDYQHQLLSVPPTTLYGANITSGYANDPVNVSTGNFIEEENDLYIDNHISSSILCINRMYNSLSVAEKSKNNSDSFGCGWSSNLDQNIEIDREKIIWHAPDGKDVFFYARGNSYMSIFHKEWVIEKIDHSSKEYKKYIDLYDLSAEISSSSDCIWETQGYFWRITNNRSSKSSIFSKNGIWIADTHIELDNSIIILRNKDLKIENIIHPKTQHSIEISYLNPTSKLVEKVALCSYGSNLKKYIIKSVEYTYNSWGYLSDVSAPGYSRRYSTDNRGLIEEVINWSGKREVKNFYDSSGRVTRQISEYGRDITYIRENEYMTTVSDTHTGENMDSWISDSTGRLISIASESQSASKKYYYNSQGDLVRVLTPKDCVEYIYDNRGNCISESHANGLNITYTWDSLGRKTTEEYFSGTNREFTEKKIDYFYETSSRLPSKVCIESPATHESCSYLYSWNSLGQILEVNIANEYVYNFIYNNSGNISEISVNNHTLYYLKYNTQGKVKSCTDSLGNSYLFTYEQSGLLTSLEDPCRNQWKLSYPKSASGIPISNNPIQVTDPEGNSTAIDYDTLGNIKSIVDPNGNRIAIERDSWGNISSIQSPSGAETVFNYDHLSRISIVTDSLNESLNIFYDSTGNVKEVLNSVGIIKKFSTNSVKRLYIEHSGESLQISSYYDIFGRLIQKKREDISFDKNIAMPSSPAVNAYTYALHGGVHTVTDASGSTTYYTYSSSGKLLYILSAEKRLIGYSYNLLGNCVEKRLYSTPGSYDYEAQKIKAPLKSEADLVYTYTYDSASNLTSIVYPDRTKESRIYDSCGRIILRVLGRYVYEWEYDECGRLKAHTSPEHGRRQYKYNPSGLLSEAWDANDRVTYYEWSSDGELTKITDPSGRSRTFIYNALGRCVSAQAPGGIVYSQEYDTAGRLTSSKDGVRHIEYSYDNSGLLVSTRVNGALISEIVREDTGRRITIKDYKLGRCLSGSENVYAIHVFQYDLCDRLVYRSLQNPGSDIPILGENGLEDFERTGSYALSFEYDRDGLLTSKVSVFGREEFLYDSTGRLIDEYAGEGREFLSQHENIKYSYNSYGLVESASYSSKYSIDTNAEEIAYGYFEDGSLSTILRNDIFEGKNRYRLSSYTYDDGFIVTEQESSNFFRLQGIQGLSYDTPAFNKEVKYIYNDSAALSSMQEEFVVRVQDEFRQINNDENRYSLSSQFYYDSAGYRIGEVMVDGSGIEIRRRTLQWDELGNLSGIYDSLRPPALQEHTELPPINRVTNIASDCLGDYVCIDSPGGARSFLMGQAGIPSSPLTYPKNFSSKFYSSSFTGFEIGWLHPYMEAGHFDLFWGDYARWGIEISQRDYLKFPDGISESSRSTLGISFEDLQVFGERVYDPGSRSFLSPDPMLPPAGASWASNPYSFMGNNPVYNDDPTGLRPISQELYNDPSVNGWASRNADAWKVSLEFLGESLSAASFVISFTPLAPLQYPLDILGATSSNMGQAFNDPENFDENGYVNWSSVHQQSFEGAREATMLDIAFGAGGRFIRYGQRFDLIPDPIRRAFDSIPFTQRASVSNKFTAATARIRAVSDKLSASGHELEERIKETGKGYLENARTVLRHLDEILPAGSSRLATANAGIVAHEIASPGKYNINNRVNDATKIEVNANKTNRPTYTEVSREPIGADTVGVSFKVDGKDINYSIDKGLIKLNNSDDMYDVIGFELSQIEGRVARSELPEFSKMELTDAQLGLSEQRVKVHFTEGELKKGGKWAGGHGPHAIATDKPRFPKNWTEDMYKQAIKEAIKSPDYYLMKGGSHQFIKEISSVDPPVRILVVTGIKGTVKHAYPLPGHGITYITDENNISYYNSIALNRFSNMNKVDHDS